MSMTTKHRKQLVMNRVQFVKDLDTEGVIPYLIQEEVINQDMADRVMANTTQRNRNAAFLDLLPTRGDRAYGIFVDILKNSEAQQPWLAELLE